MEPVDWRPLQRIIACFGASLWPLGSRAEGSATQDSDADATLVGWVESPLPSNFEEQRELQRQSLRKLRVALVASDSGIEVIDLILEAKRPILRLLLPCGTCADVSVENRLGAKKSALLARHIAVGHPALGAACAVMKSWAKRRGVYGQSCGFPSGLGFSCMVIFAAQRLVPPGAVEDIQEVKDYADVQEVYARLQLRCSEGQKELPQLLHGIFGFYAEDFDWSRHVVSLPQKNMALGADTLRIQDPVQTELDLARPYMNQARSDLLRQELFEAFQQLHSGRWDDFLAKKSAWWGHGARLEIADENGEKWEIIKFHGKIMENL